MGRHEETRYMDKTLLNLPTHAHTANFLRSSQHASLRSHGKGRAQWLCILFTVGALRTPLRRWWERKVQPSALELLRFLQASSEGVALCGAFMVYRKKGCHCAP